MFELLKSTAYAALLLLAFFFAAAFTVTYPVIGITALFLAYLTFLIHMARTA